MKKGRTLLDMDREKLAALIRPLLNFVPSDRDDFLYWKSLEISEYIIKAQKELVK